MRAPRGWVLLDATYRMPTDFIPALAAASRVKEAIWCPTRPADSPRVSWPRRWTPA
ncbi:hypothetical protein [Streptomyces antioxidans]|uniref:hypothetical protein n=1 Tax=Streptomyces antioxidans TaxID=1507734 RepID=UPI001F0AFA64|nr:hypothetical protein [Streptomyces antioxidans]